MGTVASGKSITKSKLPHVDFVKEAREMEGRKPPKGMANQYTLTKTEIYAK